MEKILLLSASIAFLLIFSIVSLTNFDSSSGFQVAQTVIAHQIPQNGLVAEFNLDTDPAKKKNQQDSQLPKLDDSVAIGKSYKFDGIDDYLQIGVRREKEKTEYTASLWFKADSQSGIRTLFQRGKTSGCFYNPVIYISSNKLFAKESGCGDTGKFGGKTHEGISYSIGQWNHVVVTRNGNEYKLYLNPGKTGKSAASGKYNSPAKSAVEWIDSIGAGSTGNSYASFFKGSIDEVFIWDRVLTEEEIIGLYSPKSLTPTPATECKWRLCGNHWTCKLEYPLEQCNLNIEASVDPEPTTACAFDKSRNTCAESISTPKGGGSGVQISGPTLTIPTATPTPLVQASVITTLVGNAGEGFADGSVSMAKFSGPSVVATDKDGNIYTYERVNSAIRKISVASSWVQTIAGTGTIGYSGDCTLTVSQCPATSAQFSIGEGGLTIDSKGNIYVADEYNQRIRKLTPNDIGGYTVSTIAGSSIYCQNSVWKCGDGDLADKAALYFPTSVAVDSKGNIYIADSGTHRIRKIDSVTGIITTIAGTGKPSFSGDSGPATSAELNRPWAITVDSGDNVYISEIGNYRIRKVFAKDTTIGTAKFNSGYIYTIAGNGASGDVGDGLDAKSAQFKVIASLSVDNNGNIYLADRDNQKIKKLSPDGNGGYIITTLAGNPTSKDTKVNWIGGFSGDGGIPKNAELKMPKSVAADQIGNLYIADFQNSRIRKITPACTDFDGGLTYDILGTVTSGSKSLLVDSCTGNTLNEAICENGLSVHKQYACPNGCSNGVCKAPTPTPTPTPLTCGGFAGTLCPTVSPGLPKYECVYPSPNYPDALGLCKTSTPTPTSITRIAGGGNPPYSKDLSASIGDNGPATQASLIFPEGLAVDVSGNIYIADVSHYRIRKLTPDADKTSYKISTAAGKYLDPGYSDNSNPLEAWLHQTRGVAVDNLGIVYFSDTGNNIIRRIDRNGYLKIIAGTPQAYGFEGDGGDPLKAKLYSPRGIAVDTYGNVFIADTYNHRIRKLIYNIQTGAYTTIKTIAGTGSVGSSGGGYTQNDDGKYGTEVLLKQPTGIAIDTAGIIYFSDMGNNRIRKLVPEGNYITTDKYKISTIGITGLSAPTGVAVSDDYGYSGNVYLYVSDTGNKRVLKSTISKIGAVNTINLDTQLSANSKFWTTPSGLAIDKKGNLYVSDSDHTVKRIIPSLTTTAPTPACTDSDYGKNYYIKGTATGQFYVGAQQSTQTDACYGDSLLELYCSEGTLMTTTYNCKNLGNNYQCANGACAAATPTPTPVGTDFELKSATVADDGTKISLKDVKACLYGSKSVRDLMTQFNSASNNFEIGGFPLLWTLVSKSNGYESLSLPVKAYIQKDQNGQWVYDVKDPYGVKVCFYFNYDLPSSILSPYGNSKRLDIEVGSSLITETNANNNKLYCTNGACSTTKPPKRFVTGIITWSTPAWTVLGSDGNYKYGIYVAGDQSAYNNLFAVIVVKDKNGVEASRKSIQQGGVGDFTNLGFTVRLTKVEPYSTPATSPVYGKPLAAEDVKATVEITEI